MGYKLHDNYMAELSILLHLLFLKERGDESLGKAEKKDSSHFSAE